MIFPIYIPSKGRAETAATPRLLAAAGVPYQLVVEPQEADAYGQHFTNLVVLPENDQGIAYVRNFIHERELGWYWMFDDDIQNFFHSSDGKTTKCDAKEALLGAQALFEHSEVLGQAALEYQQFAWRAKTPLALCGYCDVAVAIHGERTKRFRYRKEMALKEDRDFTLQVLASGLLTARVQTYSFGAPKNGSNAGGLKPLYQQSGRELEAVRRMCEAWGPDICNHVVKPDGRNDVQINWGFFKKRLKERAAR